MQKLNKLIDEGMLLGRPQFQQCEIVVQGEVFEVYYQDTLECICALFSDPEFAKLLLLLPERHYTDDSKKVWLYFDVNTGDWWWKIQVGATFTFPDSHHILTDPSQEKLDEQQAGGTVVPIIIS